MKAIVIRRCGVLIKYDVMKRTCSYRISMVENYCMGNCILGGSNGKQDSCEASLILYSLSCCQLDYVSYEV